jgi:hypothetical protein
MGFSANLFTDQSREQLISQGWKDKDLDAAEAQLSKHKLSIGMSVAGDPIHAYRPRLGWTCEECGRPLGDSIHSVPAPEESKPQDATIDTAPLEPVAEDDKSI